MAKTYYKISNSTYLHRVRTHCMFTDCTNGPPWFGIRYKAGVVSIALGLQQGRPGLLVTSWCKEHLPDELYLFCIAQGLLP